MSDTTAQDERCPHCNHKYWRNTFHACPKCHLPPDADLGSSPAPAPKSAAQVAFEQQPREARIEGMLQRIMEDQARTAANTKATKYAVWILVAWFVLLPWIYVMFVLNR